MRWLVVMSLLLPTAAMAWDPVDPERPRDAFVSVTRVVDVLFASNVGAEAFRVGGTRWWIAFEDADVLAACRELSARPEATSLNVGAYAGRYVHLAEDTVLPLVLFARAHNQQVRVKIRYDGSNGLGCHIVWFQTCADPNNCRGAEN